MEFITSVNNQRIKDVANLKLKKYRTESGTFFAEGLRAVKEAVQYAEVTGLFYTKSEEVKLNEIIINANARDTKIYQVDEKVMAKLSDTKTPQGVLAVIKMPANDLRQLRPGAFGKIIAQFNKNIEQAAKENASVHERKGPMQQFELDNNAPVIILDRVQDPGNMGTVIRTADAVGALGIILLEGCVDAYSPKVVRASMGSLFHLPVVQDVRAEEALTWCYRNGYEPAATAMKGAVNLYKADISKKMAFIFGNEANGVAEELQAAAETRLFIPMAGLAESMNVAMAAGIILFEGLRQRKFGK